MPQPLPDLSIRQLEYLVAVADSDTFALAAEQVGVSPSALSQGLAELERRVGVSLFDREGRRRVLRSDTEPVLDHARQVVALTADLAGWARRTRSGDHGRLRLGMIDASAVQHHGEALRQFRAEHPELRIHLRVGPSGDLLRALVDGSIDVAVCVEPAEPLRGVTTEALMTEDLAIYAPDGRRRPGPSAGWGPWVLFPRGAHTRTVTETALRRRGVPVEVVAESHQPEVLCEMVRLGLGWSVLPVAQAEWGEQALVRCEILARRRLVTARRSGAAPHPAGVLLEQALRAGSTAGS
ncbi:MAG: LysR family transcriptional regulator [Acidimicrobiaceae bacterium]|nr:LysR family transcriptional regulator [Acidimicrobiaceae bacterium]MYH43171.1 LysR family transcriptional regulator [Acidimicrobiaceae bacterium]MYJ41605.1 LysR family transcriptional regulator [Acidimicrobiaceae bacterium]MYJ81816.1 LysR family transcriptional regulator [Acidimicrobiaceae bacterium]